MPHFTLEYSANLDARVDMAEAVEVVRKAAVEAGIFPVGGIRVRAVRCEHYAIADGNPVFKALSSFLDPVFAKSKFALSFDIQINDKDMSWKRNNIHEALQKTPKVEAAAHG
jgi:5-carboxymethyl-2-hydroxymuconate isomerase